MQIKVELKSLQHAVDTVMRLAPPASGNLNFQSSKKTLTVTSVSETGMCSALVACEVSKDGEFAIPAQALRDAVKGRNNLELTYVSDTLVVKSGNYKTSLVAVDVVPVDEIEKAEAQTWKVTPDVADWIASSIRKVALKPITLVSPWMPVGIKIGKSAFICCYDLTHMNWVSSKEVSGDFECMLPIETMSAIMDVFSKSSFKMERGDGHIRVKNKMVDAYMSVPDMKELPTVDDVMARIREAAKVSGTTFQVAKTDVLTFMENAKAIVGKERAELLVEGSDGGVVLEVKTGLGQSRTKLKGKGKGRFAVDYEFLQELILKGHEDLQLNVVDQAYLSVKLAASMAILALNEERSTETRSKKKKSQDDEE